MPTINFGNITNIGGKNVSLGSQSGFDIEALVTNLTTAKRLPAVKYEETITKNTTKISALNSMKSKLSDLKSKLNALRNPVGLSSANVNVFDSRNAFLTMSNGATATNYLGVTTSNGAPIGNYEVEVTQLARNDKYTSITFASRTESVVQADGGGVATKFEAGNLVINGTNIALEEGDSLNDIIAQINSVKNTTGVSATVLKISETEYKLSLTATKTGADNAVTINYTGVQPGATVMFSHETTGDLNSIIQFNGSSVTRSSNSITDLVDNTTFNLYQETDGETIDLAIDKNSASVATGIADMLTAYNAIRQFNAEQSATDEDGKYLETAVLNNNSTMRTVVERMSSYMNGQAAGIINPFATTDSAPTKLSDLGVSFTDVPATDDGETSAPEIKSALDLDAAKLSTNIETYFEDVRKLFEFKFTSTSGDLDILSRNNTISTSTFKTNFTSGYNPTASLTHIDDIALTTPVALTVTGKYTISFTDGGSPTATVTHIDGVAVSPAINLTVTGSVGAYTITGVEDTDAEDISITNYSGGTGTIKNGPFTITGPSGTDLSELSFIQIDNTTETVEFSTNEIEKKFTLDVDKTRAAGQEAQVTKLFGQTLSDAIELTYEAGSSSATISGEDTVLEGLEMLYTGDGTDIIGVSFGQGLADKMFNALEEMLNETDGLIAAEISGLQETNIDLEESITKIDEKIVTYRDQLLEKFSALEAAISSANQVLLLLDAQSAARDQG